MSLRRIKDKFRLSSTLSISSDVSFNENYVSSTICLFRYFELTFYLRIKIRIDFFSLASKYLFIYLSLFSFFCVCCFLFVFWAEHWGSTIMLFLWGGGGVMMELMFTMPSPGCVLNILTKMLNYSTSLLHHGNLNIGYISNELGYSSIPSDCSDIFSKPWHDVEIYSWRF